MDTKSLELCGGWCWKIQRTARCRDARPSLGIAEGCTHVQILFRRFERNVRLRLSRCRKRRVPAFIPGLPMESRKCADSNLHETIARLTRCLEPPGSIMSRHGAILSHSGGRFARFHMRA